MEISIISHEINEKNLKEKMQDDYTLHLNKDLLLVSEMRLNKHPKDGSDIVPTPSNSFAGKSTINSPIDQTNSQENSEDLQDTNNESLNANIQDAELSLDEDVRYSVREGAAPKNTKIGYKVGEVELDFPNEADRKMWSVDITPEMKESVMEGQVISKRHTANEHKMSENLWIYVIDKINEPVAISRYKERESSYRLYVPVELNGKNVCVGVDVNTIGKNIEITNIKTAFARDIEDIQNSSTEKLLYPTAEEITMAIEQFSAAHNSLRYAQQPLSTDGKGTTNSPTDQINSQENSKNSNIVDNQGDIEEDIRYSTTDSQESSDALQSAIEIEDDEMPEYRDADHLGESMMQYFERYGKWRDKMMADNMNPDGTPKLNIPVAPICFGYPISQQNQ